METLELFDRPIAFHRVFVTLTGSVKAAVLLSQAVYWQKRAKQADGWWHKTADEWTEETGLTKREQDTARRECEKYLKTDLRGIPATLFWHVDEEALRTDLFSLNSNTSFDESAKLDSTKAQNINKELTETTTETTTTTIARENEISEISRTYESEIGMLTGMIRDKLIMALDEYPKDWIIKALEQSALNNKRNWAYAEAILKRWKVDGFQTDTRANNRNSKKPNSIGHVRAIDDKSMWGYIPGYVGDTSNEEVVINDD